MFRVKFSDASTHSIQKYVDNYLNYFEELYSDSGIWSHKKIIEWYINESLQRYNEIANIIEEKLERDIISYLKNSVIINWRSKILFVTFIEKWKTRIITDIEIR